MRRGGVRAGGGGGKRAAGGVSSRRWWGKKGCGRFSEGDRWAAPIVFVPGIRISCTGLHRQPRVRLSLRKPHEVRQNQKARQEIRSPLVRTWGTRPFPP